MPARLVPQSDELGQPAVEAAPTGVAADNRASPIGLTIRSSEGDAIALVLPCGPIAKNEQQVDAIWLDLRADVGLCTADAGWSSSVARWAHNPEVTGSNPVPATLKHLVRARLKIQQPGLDHLC